MTSSFDPASRVLVNSEPSGLDQCPVKNGFRLRGMGMTRIETFTDAAFAFATDRNFNPRRRWILDSGGVSCQGFCCG
jgi:hypothetical protein